MQGLVGVGALPFVGGSLGLISRAAAQGYTGVQAGQGDLVYIPGASVPSVAMAEWDIEDDDSRRGQRTLIVQGKAEVDKAPAAASRYEAKTFEFPTGTLRILRWKRGTPVVHQIGFATELFVLEGSATHMPLHGLSGKDVKIGAGDALYFPSGTIRNPKPAQDFVLIEAIVASATPNPKAGLIRQKDAEPRWTAQWMQDGKQMSVTTEAEFKKAPKEAARFTSKRYIWEGNSMRVSTWAAGGKTSVGTNGRVDALFYCIKGRLRRTEGKEVFVLAAGDCMREKIGNSGFWEPLEPSAYFATDAPLVFPGVAPAKAAR
jgi:mannose-6-phosphate isomerase-like protein (cupin superfamily)